MRVVPCGLPCGGAPGRGLPVRDTFHFRPFDSKIVLPLGGHLFGGNLGHHREERTSQHLASRGYRKSTLWRNILCPAAVCTGAADSAYSAFGSGSLPPFSGTHTGQVNGITKGNGMKTWKKVLIAVGALAVVGVIVMVSINQANKGVVTVQTAKVANQDSLVSQVTASGEIKPTTYTNVTAQGFGRITEILVKEGDHIKIGDKLLLQENVQANADVQGARCRHQLHRIRRLGRRRQL